MSSDTSPPEGPDLALGVKLDSIADGAMMAGHVGEEAVLLVRRGDDIFAVGAACTHYGAPLADGLLVENTIRCPWHHATFCILTGEARRAPALDPLPCWRVERSGGLVRVRERLPRAVRPPAAAAPGSPERVVIIGGGAAGNAAAETLRNEGYRGRLTMLSADQAPPCDRPNLSKAFLAGDSGDSANILRPPDFYERREIDLRLESRATAIDTTTRVVLMEDGGCFHYDALLLATGAEPVRLELPGAHLPHVHYLRTVGDARSLVANAQTARRAVVIGASFIGLEAAASLRARGLEVAIVAPDRIPMERVLGPRIGSFIRALHERHGVSFHLGRRLISISDESVALDDDSILAADLVVAGIGVRPCLDLARTADLRIDEGVVVDAHLETDAAGVFAAGDIARWPDLLTGRSIRVEHWVVAERQGQIAARNMLGRRERFDCVPFFWTEQYDFSLAYVGHAETWDAVVIEGDLEARDCTATYYCAGHRQAAAFVHRDLAGVRTEIEFERVMKRRLRSEVNGRELADMERGSAEGEEADVT